MAAPLPADFSSYWTRTSEGRPYPELEESLHAETVVVGGGIVGLSVALRLAEEGRKVAVVEALRVGRLVTGGSTAKVTAQHGLIYSYFVETLGRDKAQLYADANRTGMKQIFDWITAFAIPCDLEPRAAYLYSEREGFADAFRAEAEAARALGFDAEHLDSAPLPFKTAAALRFADQAQFNPVKYLDRLALAFAEKGGRIFEQSRVRLVDAGSRWRVVTDKGNVHAEHVVVATNLTIKSPVGMSRRTQPRMHTAMAFPIEAGAMNGMFLGVDDPAHSFRTTQGPDGEVLVALGPKFNTGHEPDVAARFADLEAWIRHTLPVGDPIAAWCNEDYETPDRVPYVGEPDPEQSPGFHIATGFNAWGISNGTAAGLLIADRILGRENAWAALYDPARPAPKDFNIGGDTASRVDSIDEIARGGGGVIVRDGKKIAVWRDDDGVAHELSASCTHKGCTVTWNNAARTWDCPCHGSMFDREGRVLHGPARKNLAPPQA